jgi:fructose-1,6-bisphosphatase/inositol monophosphatase family enzyme/DNA-binding XRE family transcriptional regulator
MTTNWSWLGPRLAALRDAKGWSRRDLADALGCDPTSIGHWETGAHKPTPANLVELRRVLAPGVLEPPTRRVNGSSRLVPLLDPVERMVEAAVMAAGAAAMCHFRPVPVLDGTFGRRNNPTLLADVEATEALLKSIVPDLEALTRPQGWRFAVYGEELRRGKDAKVDAMVDASLAKLPSHGGIVRSDAEFASKLGLVGCQANPMLGVCFDAVDGSGNLELGLGGLFVSAAAIFDGTELLAGAVYDPHGGVLYSAVSHPGGDGHPPVRRARMRHVRAGVVTDLDPSGVFGRRVLGVHISRTAKPERAAITAKLDELLSADLPARGDHANAEVLFPGGLQALNCGQAALAFVASRRFGAFVSPITSTWDIAAGEALIRAAGGKVTDFDGLPIHYGAGPEKVSVIAAWDHDVHDRLVELLANTRHRA